MSHALFLTDDFELFATGVRELTTDELTNLDINLMELGAELSNYPKDDIESAQLLVLTTRKLEHIRTLWDQIQHEEEAA